MPDDPRMPDDMDPTALLRGLDGPRALPPGLHQRLTDQLLAAAGEETRVLALSPELTSRLSDELQSQAPSAAGGAPAASLDEKRRQRAPSGLLSELRSRWTIGTSAAAAVVLLLVAVAGIVFHPGPGSNNHPAASSRSSSASGLSSGSQLYPAAGAAVGGSAASGSSTTAQPPTAMGANSAAATGGTDTAGSGAGASSGLAAAAPAPTPSVESVAPSQGSVAGGTEVTITGSGLDNVTAVHFGSSAATSVQVISPTEVKAVSPAHLPGAVDVVVVTPEGLSPTSPGDTFTYTAGATP